MQTGEDQTDVARVLAALALVVVAAIALLVSVGVAVGRVAPEIGDDDIVEAGDDVREYPHADALMAAVGCAEPQPFGAFEGISTNIRSYAEPTGARCADGTFALVYVDRDDRRTAEDDGDVHDRACATVESDTTSSDPTTTVATTAPVDPAATVALTTAPPPQTTVAVTTTTVPDSVFGLVRGPNWVLATPGGRPAAEALHERLGGVVFTETCEADEE